MKIEKWETYSNIHYFISAMIGFFIAPTMLIGVIYALVSTYLCVGSYNYHKYKTGNIFLFDWHSIIVAYTGYAGILFNNEWVWVGLIVYQFIYGLFIIGRFNVYLEVIGGAIPFAVSLYMNLIWWQASIIVIITGIAALIRNYDNYKNTRDVHYDSKNHSWWHVITAYNPLLIFI